MIGFLPAVRAGASARAGLGIRRRRVVRGGDDGSMALEWALAMPVAIVLLLAVVALGRYSHSGIVVQQAAASAARSASLTSSPGAAQTAAQQAAAATLDDAGLACAGLSAVVDTSQFRAGGQVSVTVTCTADLSQLALSGVPGSTSVSSTAAAPLETFRPLNTSRTGSRG